MAEKTPSFPYSRLPYPALLCPSLPYAILPSPNPLLSTTLPYHSLSSALLPYPTTLPSSTMDPPELGEKIRLDNPVSELTCLPIYTKEFSVLLITSTCNNWRKCTICTPAYFFRFLFCSPVQITPFPSTVAFTCQNNLFLCRKQTNNHDVILISTFVYKSVIGKDNPP